MKNTYLWRWSAVVMILVTAATTTFAEEKSEISSGILFHSVEDDFENNRSRSHFRIQDSKTKRFSKLTFKDGKVPARLLHAPSGSTIKLRGKKTLGRITLGLSGDSDDVTLAEDIFNVSNPPTTSTALSTGTKRVLAIQMNFMDQKGSCVDEATIYKNVLDPNNAVSTKNFFKANSRNVLDITGDVASVKLNLYVSKTTTCTETDVNNWARMADEMLNKSGYTTANYDHRVYFIPPIVACSWGGWGYIGGGQYFTKNDAKSWVKSCRQKTIAHELGHNLGLMHASSGVKNTSSWAAYGDHSDSMGGQATNEEFNAPHKKQLGWIPASKIQTLSTNGTYRLSPLNSASSTYPQIYRVFKADTNEYYYLSFRDRSGVFDATLTTTYANRLNITLYKDATYEYTYFVNALGLNGSQVLASTGFTVKSLSQTSSYLEFSLSGGSSTPSDTVAPTISLISPASDSTYSAGSSVTASASATDNVKVTKVDFYVSGALKNSDATSPFSCSFPMPTGSNIPVYAIAYDAAGKSTKSAVSYISNPVAVDSIAPTVTLASPLNGAKYSAGSSVTASATATDNINVTKVSFYISGALKYSDTASPFSYSFPMPTGSNIPVYAIAYDAAGNNRKSVVSYISNPVAVDSIAPAVSLASPLNGSKYSAGASVTASATASDNIKVTKVAFYVSGALKYSDTTSPFSYSFPMPTGSNIPVYTIAYDAAGNNQKSAVSYISNPATVTADTTRPNINLASPLNGSKFSAGTSITASASATDNVKVAKVNFYVGGSFKSSDTTSPFSYSFPMPTGSNISVYAIAYDAAGNYTKSAVSYISNAVTVIADTTAPSVSLTSPANGSTDAAGSYVTATAMASDNVKVAKVNFYVGGALKCSDATSPYSCTFQMPTSSSLSVYARAYDAAGNGKTSNIAYIKNPDPSGDNTDYRDLYVEVTSPAYGAKIAAGSSINITANASGPVKYVVFQVNGWRKCTDYTAPYSCATQMPTSTKASKSVKIQAIAIDAVGNGRIGPSVYVYNP